MSIPLGMNSSTERPNESTSRTVDEDMSATGEGVLAEACRPAEKLARPAVEHGQMRRQVERPAAEDVNGLV